MKRCTESDEELIINDVDSSDYETSDSEADEDEQTPTKQQTFNFVADAQCTISTTTVSDLSSTQQALVVNKKLQEHLKTLKLHLEEMLQQCRLKYKQNEETYEQIKNKTEKSKLSRQHSYYLCGHPYFKDEHQFTAPLNADYLHRKNTLGELFPIDIRDYTVNWTTKDKMFLIQGVKSQVVKQLAAKNRDHARKIKCTRTAAQKKLDVAGQNKSLERLMLSELYEMLENEKIVFKIDWFSISAENLDDRHGPQQCMALWNGYLNPKLNRNRWTKDEEDKLLQVAVEYNYENWPAIAENLPGRSGYQCFVHYQSVLAVLNVQRNVRFTKEEDDLLMEMVERYRIGSVIPWSTVVDKMPGRTKTQIYNRYMWTLKPGIKKEKFTIEEDCILTAAVKEYGPNFHKFPRDLLPGRTTVQIRNRYNNVLKFVGRNGHWTAELDRKLLALIEKHGTSAWKTISTEMEGDYSRLACRGRYVTIRRYFEKHPDGNIEDVPTKRFNSRAKVTKDNWMETIIRVKQAQLEGIEDVKPLVTATMPALTLEVFQYFKYAYRLRFEPVCPAETPATETSHVVAHLLRNNICPKDFKIIIEPQGGTIDMEYNQFADIPNDYCFPPSWCTANLLRGLTIMFSDEKVPKRPTDDDEEGSSRVVYPPELELFRKRLFSLLYSSIMCSKLDLPQIEAVDNSSDSSDIASDNCCDDDNEGSSTVQLDSTDVDVKPVVMASMLDPDEHDTSREFVVYDRSVDATECDEVSQSSIDIVECKIRPSDMSVEGTNLMVEVDDTGCDKPSTSRAAEQVICYKVHASDGNFSISLMENDDVSMPKKKRAILPAEKEVKKRQKTEEN